MSRPLPCGACGIEDYDVQMKLVEFPEGDRRTVPVLINGESVEVPERYAREPRCRDTDACDARVRAFEEPR